MTRQRLSTIFAGIGALATLGLLTSGVLMHYRILTLEGTITLLLIGILAVAAIAGLLLSLLLASQVIGRTVLRILAEIIHVVSTIAFVINLLLTGKDNTAATWWRVIAFGTLLLISLAFLMFGTREKKH